MNALNLLVLCALATCSSGRLLRYPTVYNYPGVLGAYPGVLPYAAPFTFNTLAANPTSLQSVAPIAYNVAPAATHTAFPSLTPVPYNVAPAATPTVLQSLAPLPVTYNVAPVAPVTPILSKYHSQDELGQYSFGYSGGPSSRAETRDAFGVVRGSYNYVDSEGQVQTQHYVADAGGFRVAGTNLPVAPDAPQPPAALALPQPVHDTPEVVAARAAFKTAFDEAAAMAEAAPDTRK